MANAKSIYINTSGSIYGMLMLTGKSYQSQEYHRMMVECICECGDICFKSFRSLQIGKTSSCGCKKVKHGMANDDNIHPIYSSYRNMINRCYYECHESFKDYGAKNVTICSEWRFNFIAFRDWSLANGWSEGLSIDRYPNKKGNYEPSNCRWATEAQQQRNKTNNILITAFGETKCCTDWGIDNRCSVSSNTIKVRINKLGWSAEDAISVPNINYANNRSRKANSIFIEYLGERKLLSEWCNILKLDYKLIRDRLYKGWDAKTAIETKLLKHYNKKVA